MIAGSWICFFGVIVGYGSVFVVIVGSWICLCCHYRFMDLFEHAHMRFHYRPGARNNPEIKHRTKRACPGDEAGLSLAQWVTMVRMGKFKKGG